MAIVLLKLQGYDLSLAKLFESHHDALSILNELGYPDEIDDQTWAVWAADGGPAPVQVQNNHCNGIKTVLRCRVYSKALMSYKDKEGQAQLCIVDLAHPSVHVDLSHWQAVGMQGTQTAQVHFDNTPVIPIGLPNCYLSVRVFGMVLLVLRLVGMVPRYAWLASYIKVAP